MGEDANRLRCLHSAAVRERLWVDAPVLSQKSPRIEVSAWGLRVGLRPIHVDKNCFFAVGFNLNQTA